MALINSGEISIVTDIYKIKLAEVMYNYLFSQANEEKLYFAFGNGASSNDQSNESISQLIDEVGRVALSSSDLNYITLNQVNGEDVISNNPTELIRLLGTFNPANTNFIQLNEYGLFCDGNHDKNSGKLLIYGSHMPITVAPMTLYMKYMYINTNYK